MKPFHLLLIVLMLLPVVGSASGSAQAQGTPLDEYMRACTTTETDLAAAAEEFDASLEEVEYANRARDDYREAYLIRPGCFFSTELNLRPLYAESYLAYPFVLEVIEEDLTFSQLAPEGYFLREEGFVNYMLYDFSYDQDEAGRWVWAGMAMGYGLAPFTGHAVGYNGGGFDIRLEYDWISLSFIDTFLVPEGPIVSLMGSYGVDDAEPRIGALTAFDFDSGESLWELPLDAAPRALFAAPEQTVAVVQDAQVSVLDAQTGEALWSMSRQNTRAVAGDGVLIVWGDRQLSAHEPTTGEIRWEVETPELTATHLAYVADTIVAAGATGQLAAYRAEDGGLLWEAAGSADVSTVDLACEASHDCWRIASGPDGALAEQFALADGSLLTDYALPGESAESELAVRVEPDGWVLITGQHLHARTPTPEH